ncbi:hypothetical protein Trydic_g23394, partial [Trypoxylus dichotomus]
SDGDVTWFRSVLGRGSRTFTRNEITRTDIFRWDGKPVPSHGMQNHAQCTDGDARRLLRFHLASGDREGRLSSDAGPRPG